MSWRLRELTAPTTEVLKLKPPFKHTLFFHIPPPEHASCPRAPEAQFFCPPVSALPPHNAPSLGPGMYITLLLISFIPFCTTHIDILNLLLALISLSLSSHPISHCNLFSERKGNELTNDKQKPKVLFAICTHASLKIFIY